MNRSFNYEEKILDPGGYMTQEQRDRLERILDAGFIVFHQQGYKLAQMSEIASYMNGSVGSIYSYVKSKKALFDLCFLEAFMEGFLNDEMELPFEEIDHSRIIELYIHPFMEKNWALQEDFYRNDPDLGEVITFLFSYITRFWRGIRMLDSSASQWPLLAEFYHDFRTGAYERLTEYMVRGIKLGRIRELKNPALSARLITENIAYFAMHRRYDMILHDMDENAALDVTRDAMVHAFQINGGADE